MGSNSLRCAISHSVSKWAWWNSKRMAKCGIGSHVLQMIKKVVWTGYNYLKSAKYLVWTC